jgi:hypothetical protein
MAKPPDRKLDLVLRAGSKRVVQLKPGFKAVMRGANALPEIDHAPLPGLARNRRKLSAYALT